MGKSNGPVAFAIFNQMITDLVQERLETETNELIFW